MPKSILIKDEENIKLFYMAKAKAMEKGIKYTDESFVVHLCGIYLKK